MIRLLRTAGFLLIGSGILVIAVWLIDPLRQLVAELWPKLRELPWPLQLGASLAGVGLLILVTSLIWERLGDREQDRKLLDDEL